MKGWKISQPVGICEKNQVDILDVKNTVPEIINLLDGFDSRLYTKRGQK